MAKYASLAQIRRALTGTLTSLMSWFERELLTRTKGDPGVGIESAEIDAEGNLVLTKTDQSTANAGDIVQRVLDALPDGDGVSY